MELGVELGVVEAASDCVGFGDVFDGSRGVVRSGLAPGRAELDATGAACECELPHATTHVSIAAADNKLRA
ncbi:MAG TPA: hypothetical protein VFG00_04075 [Acidothermaceae bacterium]|nr:hypothetical protein [Acidothermaceae bacterium]